MRVADIDPPSKGNSGLYMLAIPARSFWFSFWLVTSLVRLFWPASMLAVEDMALALVVWAWCQSRRRKAEAQKNAVKHIAQMVWPSLRVAIVAGLFVGGGWSCGAAR